MASNYATLTPEYPTGKFSPLTVKGKKRTLIEGLKKSIKEKQEKIEKDLKNPYCDKDYIAKTQNKIRELEDMIVDQCLENGLCDMLAGFESAIERKMQKCKALGLKEEYKKLQKIYG